MKRVHSILSPKCTARESPIHGLGVFASEPILKGELIAVWGGKIYTRAEVSTLAMQYPHFNTHPLSVFRGYYLGSPAMTEYDPAELFNHSCRPNAGVKGQILLLARRSIDIGEEVCFDYDTTEIEAVPFQCRCGRTGCRGIVDGSAWRDKAFRTANSGYLSWYMAQEIES